MIDARVPVLTIGVRSTSYVPLLCAMHPTWSGIASAMATQRID
jgi:hypothetical protein